MAMKGISAIIATVLLVAFTVAVAGILSMWATTLTTTQTQTVSNQTGGVIVCSPAIIIDEARVPAGGAGSVNVTFHNAGTQSITNINVDIRNSSTISTVAAGTLGAGQSNITSVGSQSSTVDLVKVRGVCASTVVVSDTCDPTEKCWKIG
jgi:flagellin-like protein